MTNTNIRTITTKAAYNALIEEAYHVARWQYEKSERTVYFKLMRDINTNTYYKLHATNSERFDEIMDYLEQVYTDAEIEEED
jgi:hypothetical protein